MGSFLVILKLHAYDLKAVRAAARLASSEALSDPERQIPYFAGLLNAYQHNNGARGREAVWGVLWICVCLALQCSSAAFPAPVWWASRDPRAEWERCAIVRPGSCRAAPQWAPGRAHLTEFGALPCRTGAGLLNQSSVRLQKMVCFLLLNGTNNIFSMGTWCGGMMIMMSW